jgi:Chaperonin GroEL (HSP60 family)
MLLTDVGFASKIISRRNDTIITGAENDTTKANVTKRIEKLKEKLKGTLSDFEQKMIETRISQLENGFAILKVGGNEAVRKYRKDKADDAVNATRLALKGGTIRGAGLALKEVSDQLEEDNILKRPLLSVYEQIMSSAPQNFEVAEWVRDPFLVIKSALENACSVASILATTNTIIANENKKQCYCGTTNKTMKNRLFTNQKTL